MKALVNLCRRQMPAGAAIERRAVGVGTTIANQRTRAYILGGGTTIGDTAATTVFADYGLSLGYHFTPSTKLAGFVQGSSGTNIGTHAQIGAAFSMQF